MWVHAVAGTVRANLENHGRLLSSLALTEVPSDLCAKSFASCASLRAQTSRTSSARGESAVDHQAVPRHKRRLLGTQPQNSFRNFRDPTEASDRMKSRKIILLHIHARRKPIDHLCIDHCRVDRVDANSLRGKFQRGGFR